ncbi:hypothetical protein NEHOM01_2090 [Nematocida homosporus]|uniref:uncharacterized protein n=1 Tax=Nematocida homosporus TaxID=1912981 RepID=UPI00221FA3EE|nr:uncharacterized protein NEHOM01_2090 [Nematocida homosporus]KAI5187317.1 hypothetical protein NEHOM01_2090 [Nematocida homosporus]
MNKRLNGYSLNVYQWACLIVGLGFVWCSANATAIEPSSHYMSENEFIMLLGDLHGKQVQKVAQLNYIKLKRCLELLIVRMKIKNLPKPSTTERADRLLEQCHQMLAQAVQAFNQALKLEEDLVMLQQKLAQAQQAPGKLVINSTTRQLMEKISRYQAISMPLATSSQETQKDTTGQIELPIAPPNSIVRPEPQQANALKDQAKKVDEEIMGLLIAENLNELVNRFKVAAAAMSTAQLVDEIIKYKQQVLEAKVASIVLPGVNNLTLYSNYRCFSTANPATDTKFAYNNKINGERDTSSNQTPPNLNYFEEQNPAHSDRDGMLNKDEEALLAAFLVPDGLPNTSSPNVFKSCFTVKRSLMTKQYELASHNKQDAYELLLPSNWPDRTLTDLLSILKRFSKIKIQIASIVLENFWIDLSKHIIFQLLQILESPIAAAVYDFKIIINPIPEKPFNPLKVNIVRLDDCDNTGALINWSQYRAKVMIQSLTKNTKELIWPLLTRLPVGHLSLNLPQIQTIDFLNDVNWVENYSLFIVIQRPNTIINLPLINNSGNATPAYSHLSIKTESSMAINSTAQQAQVAYPNIFVLNLDNYLRPKTLENNDSVTVSKITLSFDVFLSYVVLGLNQPVYAPTLQIVNIPQSSTRQGFLTMINYIFLTYKGFFDTSPYKEISSKNYPFQNIIECFKLLLLDHNGDPIAFTKIFLDLFTQILAQYIP